MTGHAFRVVRGAPAADELAALVLVLRVLAADRAERTAAPSTAPWARPALEAPATARSVRHPPAWRGG
ncbi:acyl-CoA carboxylase epsilon subunit [Streptomyces sp. NPDC049910]|uniref:acyl-CoA carboxylase epsilon subunit n=1 Tax=Streptomyces sp. NPDC049910 TaxID=3155278 RepID=UPI00342C08D3